MRRCLLPLSSHLLHYFCCCVGGDGAGGGFRYLTEAVSFATSPSHGTQFVIILLQVFHVRGYGVIVLRGVSKFGGKWGIFEGESGSIVFPESGGRFEPGALCRLFFCSGHHTLLINKVLYCVGPVSVDTFLQLLHHRVFEDTGLVNKRDKLRNFIVVGDPDVVLRGVVLPPCEVSSVGSEMMVGGVVPGGTEGGLLRHPFCVGYNRPSAEVSDKR